MTSTEFDKFLAERAAAAENLPTISAEAGNNKNSQQPQPTSVAPTKPKKDEENLLAL